MPTISISSLPAAGVQDLDERVSLEVFVRPEDWEGAFDVIEIWRSQDTDQGPYEELTAIKWQAAQIPEGSGPAAAIDGPSVNIVGKVLPLRVDEKLDLAVVFTGTDPITTASAASQIQAQSQGRLSAYVTAEGQLVVQTLVPGTAAVLRVLPSDAAAILGLPIYEPDSLSYGRDARVPLVHGQQLYPFVDLFGAEANFYRTRFRNTQTDSVSEYSAAFSVKTTIGVSPVNLIQGVLDLVGIDGLPLQNREVVVHNAYIGNIVDGKSVVGGPLMRKTDVNGHVEFVLVRGTKITVMVAGTNIVRDVTVPTDLSKACFNLMDPKVGTDDVFKVQVPDIEYASRRSL